VKTYKNHFGFQKEPFAQDIRIEDIYPIPGLDGLKERLLYAIDLCATAVVTGDVGTGKSTSLRYVSSKLHPSAYKILPVVANTGTILEFMRQVCLALDVECNSLSITTLSRTVKNAILEIAARKQKPVLIVDEANLMRLDVFAQIHTLMQFEFDSKPTISLVLCGQTNLVDKLMYHTSRPLASRVVGKTHLEGLNLKDMEGYLTHHLNIAGINEKLFTDQATLAILQGSGGLLRRANTIARGALMAAANDQENLVSPEHVRLAATEII